MTQTINQEVTVNAIYFSGSDMKTFPREIEYDGRAVAFASGLRYLVRRGAEALQLWDALATLARLPGVSELKRSLRGELDFS